MQRRRSLWLIEENVVGVAEFNSSRRRLERWVRGWPMPGCALSWGTALGKGGRGWWQSCQVLQSHLLAGGRCNWELLTRHRLPKWPPQPLSTAQKSSHSGSSAMKNKAGEMWRLAAKRNGRTIFSNHSCRFSSTETSVTRAELCKAHLWSWAAAAAAVSHTNPLLLQVRQTEGCLSNALYRNAVTLTWDYKRSDHVPA